MVNLLVFCCASLVCLAASSPVDKAKPLDEEHASKLSHHKGQESLTVDPASYFPSDSTTSLESNSFLPVYLVPPPVQDLPLRQKRFLGLFDGFGGGRRGSSSAAAAAASSSAGGGGFWGNGGSSSSAAAAAGSSGGGYGGGGYGNSFADSESASIGFGPFQASYSQSSAGADSYSGGRGGYDSWFDY